MHICLPRLQAHCCSSPAPSPATAAPLPACPACSCLQVAQPASNGLLGPTLIVEVGQALEIVFRNSLDFPVNIMLDGGLELLAGAAGVAAADEAGSRFEAPVAPGATKTYRYLVPAR